MELSEVTSVLNHMKNMVELALKRLDEGVRQTQENEGKVYWLNVKIQNNSQKFTKDEINKAGDLEAELKRVSASYKSMSEMAREILLEIDTYIDKANELESRGEVSWEAELGDTIKLGTLNQKISVCLNESKRCLDMQTELLNDEKKFDDCLRERMESKNKVWFIKLKSLFKGVHM